MFLNTLKFIFICLEVLAIFNLLIMVHELGHFLAARWRGLYVEGFGIWFGKPVWKKKINGVTYSLGSIPAGGFVKLPQMAPMESLEGETEIPRPAQADFRAGQNHRGRGGPPFQFSARDFLCGDRLGRWTAGQRIRSDHGHRICHSRFTRRKGRVEGGDKILEVDSQPVTRFGGMSDDSVTWRIVLSRARRSRSPSSATAKC